MLGQPIDRDWAWMICLGAGVQAFFVVGGLKSMGVLFVEIVELFDVPRSISSLTLGFLAGGFAVFAMLTNALTAMVGVRPVVIGGSILFTFSNFMAMFAINVWYLIITLGLMTGMALGAMLTPAVLLVSHYFEKRKSFANGVSFAGSSMGQLCLPYILTYLIDEYGYRGAMLIYTAITLHALCAAFLLRPVSFWGKKRGPRDPVEMRDMSKRCRSRDPVETGALSHELDSDEYRKYRDNRYSLRQDIFIASLDGSHGSLHDLQYSDLSAHPSCSLDHDEQRSPNRRSGSLTLKPGPSIECMAMIDTGDHVVSDQPDSNPRSHVRVLCLKVKLIKCRDFCKLIFDPDLMRSPSLWLIFMALGLGHDGFINAMLHLPALAVELFNDKYKGAMLVAIAGVFDIFGRLGGGWFADLGYITRANMSAAAFAITGTTTVLVTFYPVLPVMIAYCVVMGLVGGIYRILLPVIVGDVFGKAKLGPGIGMLFTALGVMVVPVPSLLGYMKNQYGTYIPAFQLCGSLLLLGATLLFLLPCVSKYDKAVVRPEPDDPDVMEINV